MGGWKVVRGVAPPGALDLIRRHVRSTDPAAAEVLRAGNTRTTVRVPGLGVLKILRRPRIRDVTTSLVAPSPLTCEFDLTRAAARRGLPVPVPVFSAERRTLGLLRGAAILLETVPGARSLEDLIRARFPRPGIEPAAAGSVRRMCNELGRILARLHQAGGVHGDTSPDNVLVCDAQRNGLLLIDWAFAVFADELLSNGPLVRRALVARAAERYPMTAREIVSALQGFVDSGGASPAFAPLRNNDVERVTNALIQCGAPLREMLACLGAYYRELGVGPGEKRRMIDRAARTFPAALRSSIRRTLRNADRSSRKTATVRAGGATVCYRRDFDLAEVRRALDGDDDVVGGMAVERREHPHTMAAWRTACVAARFHLPARLHLACRVAPGPVGVLLIERPGAELVRPDAPDPIRLARFVRLWHAFGFRFELCRDGTILEQPASLGPFTFRQGSGCSLDDLTAVTFAPDSTTDASAQTVAAWLRGRARDGAADAFIAAAVAPLRFRL